MKIKNISIIGLGLIGGSIAKAIRKSKLSYNINAYDTNEVTERAMLDHVIDEVLRNQEDALNSDLIFLCLPVRQALKSFENLAPRLTANQIITDVCGVKGIFKEKWDSFNSKGTYIGGHPMTGKEKGGYSNSDPLLFENAIYIVTDDLSKKDELNEFKKIIELLGSNILTIPAKQHDVIAASISHLPQLVSVALVNSASLKTDDYNFLDLAAGGFRDMTRIASSDFKMWESIIAENRKEILTAIDKFSIELDTVKKLIDKGKFEDLGSKFDEARKHRDEIPSNTKGFLKPLYDIYIFVQDEPGVISKISSALYKFNINIKDIELMKIREGTGGTFRISFDSKETAEKAELIIKELGFNIA